ncbi:MAG: hypothetical protein WC059_02515 [Candidatus Paceibacterota bacterium]
MENSFQTSFIPKKPIVPAPSAAPLSTPHTKSIFSILSVGLLILVGVTAGGLFLYKNYLTNQKEVLSQSLVRARDSFERDTILELETFDKRMSASKKILTSHIVLSPLFTLIGELTIPSIQYTKFEHQMTDKGLFYVKMTGTARDYKSIATQSEIFNSSKGRYLKSVVFSNLTTTEVKEKDTKKTSIGFNVEFIVDPVLLSYEKNLLVSKTPRATEPATSSTTLEQSSSVTQTPNAPTEIPLTTQAPVEINLTPTPTMTAPAKTTTTTTTTKTPTTTTTPKKTP